MNNEAAEFTDPETGVTIRRLCLPKTPSTLKLLDLQDGPPAKPALESVPKVRKTVP